MSVLPTISVLNWTQITKLKQPLRTESRQFEILYSFGKSNTDYFCYLHGILVFHSIFVVSMAARQPTIFLILETSVFPCQI